MSEFEEGLAIGMLLGDSAGSGPTPPTPTPVYGDSVLEEILQNSFIIGTVCTYGEFRVELRLWQSNGMYTGGFFTSYKQFTVSNNKYYPNLDNPGFHTPIYTTGGGIAVFIVFKNSTPIYANTACSAVTSSITVIGSGASYRITSNYPSTPPYHNKIVNYLGVYWDGTYDITKASIEIVEPIHNFELMTTNSGGANSYWTGNIRVAARIKWTSTRHDISYRGDDIGWEETSNVYTLDSGREMNWVYDTSYSHNRSSVYMLPLSNSMYGTTYFADNLSSTDIRNLLSEFVYAITSSFNSSAQPTIWVDSM